MGRQGACTHAGCVKWEWGTPMCHHAHVSPRPCVTTCQRLEDQLSAACALACGSICSEGMGTSWPEEGSRHGHLLIALAVIPQGAWCVRLSLGVLSSLCV